MKSSYHFSLLGLDSISIPRTASFLGKTEARPLDRAHASQACHVSMVLFSSLETLRRLGPLHVEPRQLRWCAWTCLKTGPKYRSSHNKFGDALLTTQDLFLTRFFSGVPDRKKPPSFSAWSCRTTHTETDRTHRRCTGLSDAGCRPKLLLRRTWQALGFLRFLWSCWCSASNHQLSCHELSRGHQRSSSHMSTRKHQQSSVHCKRLTRGAQSRDCWY